MASVKNHFNGKVDLDFAIKQAKGKKCAFAFGIGRTGAWLALDFRNQFDTKKFEKELKRSNYKNKYIVGTAVINGKVLELKTEFTKKNVKPIELKEFLAEKKLKVTRAVIDGVGAEEEESQKTRDGKK